MPGRVRAWLSRLRPEDPRRMHEFRDKVKDLKWTRETAVESMRILHSAIDSLAEAEVRYYYRRRGTRAWISGVCRFIAWAFGTIGLLLPLLAATTNAELRPLGQFGYPFLAAAASILGANSLFGGTAGHVRFVSTQLAIEKLITSSRLEWAQHLANLPSDPVTDEYLKEGFALLHVYATALYTTTIAETGRWAETLVAELSKFQKTVDGLGKGHGKTV